MADATLKYVASADGTQQHIAMDTAPEQFIEAIVAFALSEADENVIIE